VQRHGGEFRFESERAPPEVLAPPVANGSQAAAGKQEASAELARARRSYKSVRSFQISGNSTTSSILRRQPTPLVPSAALEADDALHRRDMTEAPQSERVFQVGQFLAQLIQLTVGLGRAVHRQPGLFDGVAGDVGLGPVALDMARKTPPAAPMRG